MLIRGRGKEFTVTGVTVEAEDLTKRFGSRTAVDGVSFTAQQGEVLGLLGPNGAGKTTTIRLLTTLLRPTGGRCSVAGIPHQHAAQIRRRVGVLCESAGYPGHQTGREYLRYHARLFGLSGTDADRVAEDLVARVDLTERAASRISTYSRGMRQRLGIARALVNDPAVVFLDEPTLGLDPAGQQQVLEIVRGIALREKTVVLCTHTLPDVEAVCTTVLILERGRVLTRGPVAEVTGAVAAFRSARLRVPVELVDRATRALAAVPGLTAQTADERPDILRVSTAGQDRAGERSNAGMNDILQAMLRADVPVLSFDVEGTRLNDAFLTMTGGTMAGRSGRPADG
jgi:ABC-2 type transport system ATP-binding protein